jgi:uncharacterized repeat protein (TIGR03803 family)
MPRKRWEENRSLRGMFVGSLSFKVDAFMFGMKSRIVLVASFGLLFGLATIATPASAASKEKVLYNFCARQLCPDGASPWAGLVSDAAGNLYGTTLYGGDSNCTHGCGAAFELTPVNGKWKQKVLHHFESDGKDGNYPVASLIIDKAGNLYGTTQQGGADGAGTVFELMPEKDGKWKEKILHSFLSTGDGVFPDAALVFGADGKLYGTTYQGGLQGYGTVFNLTPIANGRWTEKVLHNFDFNGTDGTGPLAGLIFDSSGNLYGTTQTGGSTNNGTVFEMTPAKNGSWAEKVLYNFTGGLDGCLPDAGLVFDAAGNLYSTSVAAGYPYCYRGGGCGTVFELTPGTKGQWTLSTLFDFEGSDGAFPYSGLVFDAAGNLYGTTNGGGAYISVCNLGCGTVFRLTPGAGGTWTESALHSFDDNGVDGYLPYGGLVRDAAGNLYGTTYDGGAQNYGAVVEITP